MNPPHLLRYTQGWRPVRSTLRVSSLFDDDGRLCGALLSVAVIFGLGPTHTASQSERLYVHSRDPGLTIKIKTISVLATNGQSLVYLLPGPRQTQRHGSASHSTQCPVRVSVGSDSAWLENGRKLNGGFCDKFTNRASSSCKVKIKQMLAFCDFANKIVNRCVVACNYSNLGWIYAPAASATVISVWSLNTEYNIYTMSGKDVLSRCVSPGLCILQLEL